MIRWAVLSLLALVVLGRAALAGDLTPDQKSAICGPRASCAIAATEAGSDRSGAKLIVVEARFAVADRPPEAPETGCIDDNPDGTEGYAGGREFWLLQGDAAPRRLLALCNDGYGAAGMGEDEVKIFPNGIQHFQAGGSAWRWETTKTYRLAPLAVTRELTCTYNVAAAGTGQIHDIDRLGLHVRAVGYAARRTWTDAQMDCPDWSPMPDRVLPRGPDLAGAYPVIMPFPENPAALPDGTALGDCALELSTDGLHGFLVHGKVAAAAESATLRVVQETETTFLVQIHDPLAAAAIEAAAGKSWVQSPHVEIWTGEDEQSSDEQGAHTAYRQIGIDLQGHAFAGAHDPADLPTASLWQARDESGRAVTVMRLAWADQTQPLGGLGIVYSQAGGGKQLRLIASVLIRKNRPLFLPDVWRNYAEENGIPSGRCALKDGRLVVAAP